MGGVQAAWMMPVLHTGDEKWRLMAGAIEEWGGQHQSKGRSGSRKSFLFIPTYILFC